MTRLLVVTTLALKSLHECTSNLLQWQSYVNVDIVVFIEAHDLYTNTDKAYYLQSQLNIPIIQYKSATQSGPHVKKSPLFSQIWNYLSKYKSQYDILGFVNSDIIPHFGKGSSGDLDLNRLFLPNISPYSLILVHRIDITKSFEPQPSVYIHGYDLFLFPSQNMELINTSTFSLCRIGQVGWDYLLPLSQPFHLVASSISSPLYHFRHDTGSNQPWDEAILELKDHIDRSWFKGLPIIRTVFSVVSLLYSSLTFLISLVIKQPTECYSANLVDYYLARAFYYLVIHHLLRRMAKT